MKRMLPFFAIVACLFFVAWFELNKPNENGPQPTEVFIEKRPTLKELAYESGYEQGKMAFTTQFENPNAINSSPIEEYTSSIVMSDEEKREYEETSMKGYVDGYHKASESLYCPRKECGLTE